MASASPVLPPGIQKENIRHPPSLKSLPPREGDQVEVHYVSKTFLDCRTVDSSRDKGIPLALKLGSGQVFKGWEMALQTMRKGEHARFTIAPPFAYGDAGDAAIGVPPASTIVLELELLKCPKREDLFDDGGAIKLEVKAGGGRPPRSTDEVEVTYVVTVQGEGVAMQRKRVVHRMGCAEMGQIGKVLEKTLLSMNRGDEVLVSLQPQYAYGEEGRYAGKLATMSVKLEEIYEVYDVSLGEKDKHVLRKRIKEGEGVDNIVDSSVVRLVVKSVIPKGTDNILKESQEVEFIAGNGDVCDAIEGAVLGMREGDEALLRCSTSCACVDGLTGLPADLASPVMMHVSISGFDKAKEKWDLSGVERIERGQTRKLIAGDLFKRGRVRLACHHYGTIADLFVNLEFFDEADRKSAAEVRRIANLNKAMCMLKLGNMMVVKELCSAVLAEESFNAKALFRRAKAHLSLKEYTEAISDLGRLLDVEPGTKEGISLLRDARLLRKESDMKSSFTFAKMCAGLGDMPDRHVQSDAPVTMPNLEEEFAKLAKQHGLPAARCNPPKSSSVQTGSSGGADACAEKERKRLDQTSGFDPEAAESPVDVR